MQQKNFKPLVTDRLVPNRADYATQNVASANIAAGVVGMSANTGGPRIFEVPASLSRLKNALDYLEKSLEVLQEKLTPASVQSTTLASLSSPKEVNKTLLGGELISLARRAEQLRAYVDIMADSLEL